MNFSSKELPTTLSTCAVHSRFCGAGDGWLIERGLKMENMWVCFGAGANNLCSYNMHRIYIFTYIRHKAQDCPFFRWVLVGLGHTSIVSLGYLYIFSLGKIMEEHELFTVCLLHFNARLSYAWDFGYLKKSHLSPTRGAFSESEGGGEMWISWYI